MIYIYQRIFVKYEKWRLLSGKSKSPGGWELYSEFWIVLISENVWHDFFLEHPDPFMFCFLNDVLSY